MDQENNQDNQIVPNNQSSEQPPKHCVRCGAALHGRFCSLCGLAEDTTPPPQYIPVAPQKKKLKTSTIVLIVLAIVVGIALLVGGCSALFIFADRAGTFEPSVQEPFDAPPSDDFSFDFGYSNETKYSRVDVLNTARSPGSIDTIAPEGKEYLIVNLRITNIGDNIISYDTADFELCNSSGNLVPAQYTNIDAPTALGHGRLLPRGAVEGSVVFLIPKGELNLVLYMNDYESTISFPII